MDFDDQPHHINQFLNNNFTALCFDRSEFNGTNFNVDSFLAKARRRGASLEQIRDDARVYLKIIQNAMIELINKDYADFVLLSSNLAGLRGAVEKLGVAADEMVLEFEQTAAKIKSAVDELTKETDDKRHISSEQRVLESRIIALATLDRLKKFLSSPHFSSLPPEENGVEKDFEVIRRACYMIEELQAIRNSCITSKTELHPKFEEAFSSVLDCFQDWLEARLIHCVQNSNRLLLVWALRGFTACDRLDAAQAIFLAQFIDSDIRDRFADMKKQKVEKMEQFKKLLDEILVFRKRFWPLFVRESDAAGKIVASGFSHDLDESAWKIASTFLDDCLLTALLAHLQDRFSSILIPTDSAVFRKAYRLLIGFAEEWSKSRTSNKILKMVFDKFSLPIYYQLCYHEVTSAIDANAASLDELLPPSNDRKFSLKFTSLVYCKLISIWSSVDDESLFLPPLISKFWELTVMIINRYGYHLTDAVGNFQKRCEKDSTERSSLENGDKFIPKRASSAALSSVTSPAFSTLIYYCGDLRNLECQTRGDLLPRILNQCGIEGSELASRLEHCLGETFSSLLQGVSVAVTNVLTPLLSTQVSSQLSSVVEVPRQYRWTRKEAPTHPSPYLTAAFEPIRHLLDVSSREMPNDNSGLIPAILQSALSNILNSYTANLKTVVESVEKISSSLSRLKTKGGGQLGDGRSGSIPDNMAAVTDEQKIRMQLRLDVEEFERIVNTFQLPFICDLSEMKALVISNAAAQEP